MTDELEKNKENMTALKAEEQLRTTAQQDIQQRLKAAQDQLDSIESEMNSIVARLGSNSRQR